MFSRSKDKGLKRKNPEDERTYPPFLNLNRREMRVKGENCYFPLFHIHILDHSAPIVTCVILHVDKSKGHSFVGIREV